MAKSGDFERIPKEHMALIGEVVHHWSILEFNIDETIWHLMDVEHQLGACVTAQLQSIHPKKKALLALLILRNASQPSIGEFKQIMGKLGAHSGKRNRLVHDARFVNSVGQTFRMEITAKPKIQFGPVIETVDELSKLKSEIADGIVEFQKSRDRVITEIDNMPSESQPTLLSLVRVENKNKNQDRQS